MRAVTGAALAGLAAACGLPDGEYFGRVPDPDPSRLVFCNSGEPEYLDPGMITAATDINPAEALFDGLTEHTQGGFAEPSLARSWEVSADQRAFTFHLRADARWSDGAPVTADDAVYSIARVLHPITGSRNAEVMWKLKNGELYSANRVRRVLRDTAGLRRGDIVEVVGLDGAVAPDLGDLVVPDSNLRASGARLALRDLGAPERGAYASVPPGRPVTIVELGGPARDWAYVFFDEDDGVYGWVPLAQLDREPNGAVRYTVRRVRAEHIPGASLPPDPEGAARPTAVVRGADLLMLPDVLGARAPDPATLVLETWGPSPYLVEQTVQREFRPVPRRAVSRWPRRWTQPEHIVTSGAFHLTDWRIRDRIEMVRSPTFWDRAHVRLERLTIFSMADQAANTNLYIQGGCDALAENNIPSSYLPFLTGRGGDRPRFRDFTVAPFLATYFYAINTRKFTNVHFRRALDFAVDRSLIPGITRGGELPTAQYTPGRPIRDLSPAELALCGVAAGTPGVAMIVVPGELCYVPPPGLDFDPARARAELARARREMGAAFPSRFTIKYNTGFESHKLIAEWLASEWQRTLGLEVEIESQEFKTFLKDTVQGAYDVARYGWIGNFPDPEAEFLNIFKCRSPDNRPRFCSPAYDGLLARAGATQDRRQRLALAREAERLLIEEAAIIPLYVYTQKHLRKPYVRDLAVNITAMTPFRRVWIDPDWRAGAGGPAAVRPGAAR